MRSENNNLNYGKIGKKGRGWHETKCVHYKKAAG